MLWAAKDQQLEDADASALCAAEQEAALQEQLLDAEQGWGASERAVQVPHSLWVPDSRCRIFILNTMESLFTWYSGCTPANPCHAEGLWASAPTFPPQYLV